MSYFSEVTADTPALYWTPGYEGGGTHCWDYSGNERHGEYKNSPTFGIAGPLTSYPVGRAITVEATSNERIDSSYNPFTAGSSVTLECWAWLVPNATNNRLMGSNGTNRCAVSVTNGSSPLQVNFTAESAAGGSVAWAGAFPTEQWVHVVVSFDNPGNSATLYINGESKGSKTVAADFGAAPGVFQAATSGAVPWNGRIAHVALYAAALSGTRIKAHYDAAKAAPSTPAKRCYQGALIEGATYGGGYGDSPYDQKTTDEFAKHSGRKPGIIHFSDPWLKWDGFGAGASAAHGYGAIVLKSVGSSGSGTEELIAKILKGDYDADLRSYARAASDWGKPFFFRLWWEMNGTWYQWGRTTITAAQYREAWQRAHDIMAPIAQNMTWVWCPNVVYEEAAKFSSFYPGDSYVDWVGIDGYNESASPWRGPTRRLHESIVELQAVAGTKPIIICETSSIETGGSKADWFRDLLGNTLQEVFPQIRAYVHYNNDTEKPYDIESSESAQTAFAEAIASEYFVNPNVGEFHKGAKIVPYGSPLPNPAIDAPLRRVHVREHPRTGLHYELRSPSGRYYRWGKDEPRPENVPSDGGFSTSMPGGFDTQRVTLPRKPQVDYADLGRLTTLRALGAGGDVASEVRLQEAPRASGDQYSIGPEAVGWRAHLGDDTTAAEWYIGRDLNDWGEVAGKRKSDMRTNGFNPERDLSVEPNLESGVPQLSMLVPGPFDDTEAEAVLDSGGIDIARLIVESVERVGLAADASLTAKPRAWTTDIAGSEELGSEYKSASSIDFSPTAPSPYVVLDWTWSGAGPTGSDGQSYGFVYSGVASIGNHLLPLQGEGPTAGLLASDVIAHAVARWAPLLRFSTGPTGTLRPSAFVIPHLTFKEKTTAQGIVEGANRYELRPYAVWEGPNPRMVEPTFYYHDWGDRGRTWRGRVAPTQLADTGPTVDRLRNGVIVTWQDVDGSARFAGPVGSGCHVEDPVLEDLDPENPANQLGLKMYGPPLSMEGVSVASEAVRIGVLLLSRLKESDSSGQAQFVGICEDDRGVIHPAWRPRAGDYYEPVDAADKRRRRIIRTDYSESTLTNTITLDAPPDEPEDLLAQLGVSVADIGV